jgi:hypothetical protein
MTVWINEESFTYVSGNGTRFECERSDFRGLVHITRPAGLQEWRFLQDFAEMIAHHRGEVWPRLNGFSGYDTLRFYYPAGDK